MSKLSIRKHSCFEALLHEKPSPLLSPSSPSSSKKPLQLFSFLCTSFFLFLIAISVFLHCCSTNLAQSPTIPSKLTAPDDSMASSSSSSSRKNGDGGRADTDAARSTAFSRIEDRHGSTEGSWGEAALRGLGRVFRRGNRVMGELIVAHVGETTPLMELRVFLRTLHRCGLTARADVVLLFDRWSSLPPAMVEIIDEENESFQKLLHLSARSFGKLDARPRIEPSADHAVGNASIISPFNVGAFLARTSSELGIQSLWGSQHNQSQGIHHGQKNRTAIKSEESPYPSSSSGDYSFIWGSIVGFEASELNPDDTLQGFIDNPSLSLRRWACYQMLLGMVKHKFKQVLLTEARGVAILGDPLAIARRRAGLYIPLEDRPWASSSTLRPASDTMDPSDQPSSRAIYADKLILKSSSRSSDSGGLNSMIRLSSQRIRDDKPEAAGSVSSQPSGKLERMRDGMVSGELASRRRSNGIHEVGSRRLHVHTRRSVSSAAGAAATATTTNNNGNMSEESAKLKRRRRGRRGLSGGLYERVYGRSMWNHLEEGEKKKRLVNSGAIVGSMQQVRGLANTMVTEIVKVSLERKSRDSFPDNVLLSYLLHKSSSVLGRRVLDHLHLMDNGESFVHSTIGSAQGSLFWRKAPSPSSSMSSRVAAAMAYPMIHGMGKSRRWGGAVRLIRRDICSSSPLELRAYDDCEIDHGSSSSSS